MKVESIKIKVQERKINGRLVMVIDRADLRKERRKLMGLLSRPKLSTDDRGLAVLSENERDKCRVALDLIEKFLVRVRRQTSPGQRQ